jgi:transposase-like protein
MRESGQSWKELLVDLKARGLVVAPQVAIGDGALGFWKALDEAFPTTRHQRCWLHKTLNVLDKLPKSVQPNAHKDLREIWLSPSRGAAEAAMTTFAEKYAPKYDRAVECLIKDQQTLLTFFDLPADHWDHLRTSNPIESVFATVRHRTVRMKGALSQDTARLMVFKLVMAAVQDLAMFERSKPVAESRQRYKVQGRNRNCRRNQIRRLIHAVTDFPA